MELFRYIRKVTMAEKRDGREEEKNREERNTLKEGDPMEGST